MYKHLILIMFSSFFQLVFFVFKEIFVNPKATKIFSYVFFQKPHSFSFYIQVYVLCHINFCIWCEVRVKVSFLPYGSPIVLSPFVERLMSLLNFLYCFVENQLPIYLWIYFQTLLYSIDLICSDVYAYYIDQCGFTVNVEIK